MTDKHMRAAHAAARHRRLGIARGANFNMAAITLAAATLLGAGLALKFEAVPAQFQLAKLYLQSQAALAMPHFHEPVVTVTWSDGTFSQYYARNIVGNQTMKRAVSELEYDAGLGGMVGLCLGVAALLAVAQLQRRDQAKLLADRFVAGTQVVSESELAKQTAKFASPRAVSFGRVAWPDALERRHLALLGTTGTGKTTILRRMLDGIEARGEAALVFDTSGEFIKHYYNPARGDVILNPFDARGVVWNPFDEISHPGDADRIAAQLIPETGEKDRDVWLHTARILVANMLRTLWQEGKTEMTDLLEALQSKSKDELGAWLAHTSSARTFADEADRATGSVLFMLARAANLIQFLRLPIANEAGFSFRDFYRELDKRSKPHPWVFVPRKESQFTATKPLLALWLDCAASATLDLAPDDQRRLWFILDELADLPRVENLTRLLPEGRKFGAACIITFQAIGQMIRAYGKEGAEAMLGCCNTKLFLLLRDPESQEWASRAIGDQEVERPSMTDAFEAGEAKIRTNLSHDRIVKPAFMPSEFNLPKYTGYLSLPDGLPVARLSFTDTHIKAHTRPTHPAFIEGDVRDTLWGTMVKPVGAPEEDAAPLPGDSQGPV